MIINKKQTIKWLREEGEEKKLKAAESLNKRASLGAFEAGRGSYEVWGSNIYGMTLRHEEVEYIGGGNPALSQMTLRLLSLLF